MADPGRRHAANAPGLWFVDTTCIDCDASAQCAPWMFDHVDDQAVVVRQPATADEERAAARALLACPSGSIGTTGALPVLHDLYPHHLGDTAAGSRVHYCGYNASSSFGANAYFVRRADGNLLVDAPRWVRPLARAFEEAGGLAHVLLTHRDDVADAQRYAAHFGARVWIHDADRDAAPYATDILVGRDPAPLAPGVLAVPVAGHTRGSVAYIVDDEGAVLGRFALPQPDAGSPVGVRRRGVVLVDGAGGVAGPPRGAPVRVGAAGPRRPPPRRWRDDARPARRPRRAHAPGAARRGRMVVSSGTARRARRR